MATTYVKREYGYGPESALPSTIKEGRELIATDTLKHTLDADGKRIELNPPGDMNETNQNHPSYISDKPDITEAVAEIERYRIGKDVRIYGVLWDKTSSAMRRIFDAHGITTDTMNFVYSGSVNANYNNPFDKIYPWSDCKQCNVDLAAYRNLQPGDDIRDAVVSWYGDYDFQTSGSNGFVGRYTPEFWYKGYEDSDGRKIIMVADGEIEGFLHHKAAIRGHGFCVDDGDGGVTCNDGQPMCNISCSTIHTKAKTSGFTLRDIFEADAETALFMVEFASMDAQAKLGNGCSAGYYSPNFTVLENATGATTVLLPAAAKQYCIPGATLDFGSAKDGSVVANRRTIISAVDYGSTYVQVTFDEPLDLTTSMYPSIHGKNNADSIGNKSGYVGVNGKNNAWYRGAIMHANRWQYTLGCYRQTGTNRIWLATPETADDYDVINTSQHYDTGIKLLTLASNSWQQVGDYAVPNALASIGPIVKAGVLAGDKQYCIVEALDNTVSYIGGPAGSGTDCGVLCILWNSNAGGSNWYACAIPLLRSK